MFKIKKTKFKDLLVVSGMFHGDSRGYLREILIEKINNFIKEPKSDMNPTKLHILIYTNFNLKLQYSK